LSYSQPTAITFDSPKGSFSTESSNKNARFGQHYEFAGETTSFGIAASSSTVTPLNSHHDITTSSESFREYEWWSPEVNLQEGVGLIAPSSSTFDGSSIDSGPSFYVDPNPLHIFLPNIGYPSAPHNQYTYDPPIETSPFQLPQTQSEEYTGADLAQMIGDQFHEDDMSSLWAMLDDIGSLPISRESPTEFSPSIGAAEEAIALSASSSDVFQTPVFPQNSSPRTTSQSPCQTPLPLNTGSTFVTNRFHPILPATFPRRHRRSPFPSPPHILQLD
jgi:hypothetical protein